MVDREHILHCLQSHIFENYDGPLSEWSPWKSRKYFAQASYAKWAANEFLDYLRGQPVDIYISAENFVKMMDEYACSGHPNRWMFSVAYDVAVDLQDFLYALK